MASFTSVRHHWCRTQAAWTKRKENKSVKTMASFVSVHHHGWSTQAAWNKKHLCHSVKGPRLNKIINDSFW